MKSQRIRREIESGRDRTGWQAVGARFDKQPKNIEAIILGKCSQGRDGICFFHISTNIEIKENSQGYFSVC